MVDESKGQQPYRAVETLAWSEAEEQQGKVVKVKGFAKNFYLKLFRVPVSTDKTDFFQVLKSASTSLQILTRILVPEIVTNDMTQDNTEAAQQESSQRWKIEQFHREAKQLTGLEHCQCRLNRSQRNHLCARLLVWSCLSDLAHKDEQTLYSLKYGLLADYLKQQLSSTRALVLLN